MPLSATPPELIIALVALKAGYPDMVRASIIGAILANLLLALGTAFFLGGLRHRDQRYNPAAAGITDPDDLDGRQKQLREMRSNKSRHPNRLML